MKKLSYLIVFAALSLISTTTIAQEVKVPVKNAVKEMLQEEKVEVNLSELPEAVTDVLSDEFEGYTAKKAYKAIKEDKEVFYIKLEKEGEYIKVLITLKVLLLKRKKLKLKNKANWVDCF